MINTQNMKMFSNSFTKSKDTANCGSGYPFSVENGLDKFTTYWLTCLI